MIYLSSSISFIFLAVSKVKAIHSVSPNDFVIQQCPKDHSLEINVHKRKPVSCFVFCYYISIMALLGLHLKEWCNNCHNHNKNTSKQHSCNWIHKCKYIYYSWALSYALLKRSTKKKERKERKKEFFCQLSYMHLPVGAVLLLNWVIFN